MPKSGILTPEAMIDPKLSIEAQKAESLQRIAIGFDMLVGLLAHVHGLELEEVSNENGAAFYRWRTARAEAAEGQAEEPSNSQS